MLDVLLLYIMSDNSFNSLNLKSGHFEVKAYLIKK